MNLNPFLNPAQQKAVEHTEGPLLVLAGAGSGKTRVITTRIAYLIRVKKIKPDEIIALTFTNKAANEMKKRVAELLSAPGLNIWISTFHSACLRILKKHAPLLGFAPDFVIYDKKDQLSLLKDCLKSLDINKETFPPPYLLAKISNYKNNLITPEIFKKQPEEEIAAPPLFISIYELYQQRLKKNNALDFDDLLMWTVTLLENQSEILSGYQKYLRYILVDEYQDTNYLQYRLVSMLGERHQNICVVGDDDQSIYQWRGADIRNILEFENDFPRCQVIKLEENYRSTQNILRGANAVVDKNFKRKSKTLWTKRERGRKILYYRAQNGEEEADFVSQQVQRLTREENIPLREIAVLYRINAQSRVIEDRLRRTEIPYQIVGGLKFYERKEIKDILAYLKIIANPDDSLSLQRIINLPPRGIGPNTLKQIFDFLSRDKLSLNRGIEEILKTDLLSKLSRKKLKEFSSLLTVLRGDSSLLPTSLILKKLLKETGYLEWLGKNESRESREKVKNVRELITAVEEFEKEHSGILLKDYINEISLTTGQDFLKSESGWLTLMTLHLSKGLEFRVVFIIGLENGIFPHGSAFANPEEMAEERRLCYVGMTRARDELILSNALMRKISGETHKNDFSLFIKDIPPELLQRIY